MTTSNDFERQLRRYYEAHGQVRTSIGLIQSVIDETATIRQRPGWLAALRSPSMTATTIAGGVARPRTLALVGAALLLALAALAAGLLGSKPAPHPIINGPLAYGLNEPSLGDTVVHIVNPDGTRDRVLRPETNECPRWSPDGSEVAMATSIVRADGTLINNFPSDRGGVTVGCSVWSIDASRLFLEGWSDTDTTALGIYSIRVSDGGGFQRITTSTADHDIPQDVSPDGKQIYFIRSLTTSGGAIMVANVDGSNERRIGNLTAGAADLSPDGTQLLIDFSGSVYFIDVATGKPRLLKVPGLPGPLFNAHWSPDGTRIALVNGAPDEADSEVWTINVDGSDPRRVTNDDKDVFFLDWGTKAP
jgi:WD40 repeat protein